MDNTSQKKVMISRCDNNIVYIYESDIAGDEYNGYNIRKFNVTTKLMCTQTTQIEPPKRKGGKQKEIKTLTYTVDISENDEIMEYIKKSEFETFGIVFSQGENVWQIFLCKLKDDNPLSFDVLKFKTRYAISKNISLEQAINGIKDNSLYLLEN